ncbi:hypothetical protein OG612_45615 (plasmid) [Streptomyces sp. NBC_01527]|uniref:hypothetical protein n=1 Tax=Streptomyces sp. NBC_01527 TaxID=2903894 RepID=UPI002F912D0E
MMTTSRTRYHVGMNEIGLDPVYRIECLADFDGARAWLTGNVENTTEDVQDPSEFDALLDRLARTPDAQIVGEYAVDAYVFWVRAVEDCGCPCDCAERGEECDPRHNREAAAEPELTDPDEHGRSVFRFDGVPYTVFNTSGRDLDGYWAVERVPAESPALPSRDYVLVGQRTREHAFTLAVEKLRPSRHITFLPQRYSTVTMSEDDRDYDEYPHVTRDGWVCAWSTAGYVVVFEDRVQRGIVWPGHPVEASVTRDDGTALDIKGEWRFFEQAAAAVRDHVLTARV